MSTQSTIFLDLRRSIFSVLPKEGKDELAVYFVNEDKEMLKGIINSSARSNSVMLDVKGISVSM